MATKVFTTIPGPCPFGYKNNIDDHLCRLCPFYYRAGTGTFFWCNAGPSEPVPNMVQEILHPKPKRGRPRKTVIPGKPTKKAVKRTKPKKR